MGPLLFRAEDAAVLLHAEGETGFNGAALVQSGRRGGGGVQQKHCPLLQWGRSCSERKTWFLRRGYHPDRASMGPLLFRAED